MLLNVESFLVRYSLSARNVSSVTYWVKAPDFGASAGGESRVRAPLGWPHFAATYNGVRVSVAGIAQRPESVSGGGAVSSLPGTLNFRIKFCHSTRIMQ